MTDGSAAGRVKFGGRQANACRARVQGENSLNTPFAVTSITDNRGSTVVSQCSSEDLACTCRILVDQDDQWNSPSAFERRPVGAVLIHVATLGGHNCAGSQEHIGDVNRSIK